MNISEFSNAFTTLLNSYSTQPLYGEGESKADIVLDEWEKSVLLTNAFEDIVKELYTGNYLGNSFESSERLRRELDFLVTTETLNSTNSTFKLADDKFTHTIYKLDSDCLYIIYEQVQWQDINDCLNNKIADVYPVTHDDYWRVRNNPFKGPNSRRVLRLDAGDKTIELVSSFPIGNYTIRYIKYPEPIILVDLEGDLNIRGKNTVTDNSILQKSKAIHQDILERAVRMAIASKSINLRGNGEK